MSAIIFDLDGTLVDSVPDIRAAVNQMLVAEGEAELDLATVTSFVGHGLPKLVERVIRHKGLDMGQHARLTQATLQIYSSADHSLTSPYPGMLQALQSLRAQGYRLGLCTNKPELPARQVLAALRMEHMFDAVVGGDTLPVKKPDPAPLKATLQALGAPSALFVGDSEVDAATAQAAALPFALYTEGYRKSPVRDLPHDASFDHFEQLPAIVAQLLPVSA